jgi:di/tricarboxylate transporter
MDASGIVITIPAQYRIVIALLAPVILAVVKQTIPALKEKLPSWAWPALSAIIGVILTALGISTSGLDLAAGAVAGLAGSKMRDLATGKSASVEPL